jgi:hypothetical protein
MIATFKYSKIKFNKIYTIRTKEQNLKIFNSKVLSIKIKFQFIPATFSLIDFFNSFDENMYKNLIKLNRVLMGKYGI